MKKIVYLVSEDWYFCSHRLNLAREAIKSGFSVYLLANINHERQLIEKYGIKIIPLKYLKRSRINLFGEFFSLLEIYIKLNKIKPNILHSVALKPVIYGSLSTLFLKNVKNINALGGLGFIFSSGSLKAKILRPIVLNLLKFICNRKKNILILQNRDDYKFVFRKLKLKQENISLIKGAGVDCNKFKESKNNNQIPVILLASRMIWDKGVKEFFNAAKLIKNKGIKAKFVLVGKPDLENPNSISLKQLNLWNNSRIIQWWGYRSDMIEVFKAVNIVTLPTFYGEGIPKVLIEGMACSKPIVTTDMPGCRDIVQDGKNGILVKPKDFSDLAKALEKLILDPDLCKKMGSKGRALAVENYSQEKIFSKIINLYLDD